MGTRDLITARALSHPLPDTLAKGCFSNLSDGTQQKNTPVTITV
jgi:hypothetical protein